MSLAFSGVARGLPTAKDLLEALRRDNESWEDLAARLPISLSTVNRWKKKSPADWAAIMEMLAKANWLVARPREEAAASEQSTVPVPGSSAALLHQLADEVTKGFAKLDRRLGRLEQQRPAAAAPVPPKQKRAS